MTSPNVIAQHATTNEKIKIMFWQLFTAMICLMMATLAFAIAIVPGLTSGLPLGYKPSVVFVIIGCMCLGLAGIFTWVYVETMNAKN